MKSVSTKNVRSNRSRTSSICNAVFSGSIVGRLRCRTALVKSSESSYDDQKGKRLL